MYSAWPTLPAAKVEAVGPARERRIDVLADLRVPFPAVAAAPAGDVERDRNEVALLDELHIPTHLDDLTGVLVAEHHPERGSGPDRCAGRCRRCS